MSKVKSGDGIAQKGSHQEAANAKKGEKMLHANVETKKDEGHQKMKVTKKKGGKVERKRGGMVPGAKPAMRLDKRARGGAAKSPLSGANTENMGYAHGNLGIDQGGKGKEKH